MSFFPRRVTKLLNDNLKANCLKITCTFERYLSTSHTLGYANGEVNACDG